MSKPKTLKVLVLIARLNQGGTARFIENLYTTVNSEEINILVASGNVQEGETEDSCVSRIPIHKLKHLGRRVSIYRDLLAYFELWRLIRKIKPHIIYSHTFKAGILSRTIPSRAAKIHAFHGHHLNTPGITGWKLKSWIKIESILARRTNLLITTGNSVANDLLQVGIGKISQYFSIKPYVRDLKRVDKKQSLSVLDLSYDKRVKVLWMGRLVPVKRPESIFKLAAEFEDCLFLVAGAGEIQLKETDFKGKNVKLLGWKENNILLSVADILISTSANEGLPNSLIEASLASVPIVATNVGSVSEIVMDGVSGYLSPDVDENFSRCLKHLIENSVLRINMGKKAREVALNKFGPEQFARDQIRLFRSVA